MAKAKDQSLDHVLGEIEKKFGAEAIRLLGRVPKSQYKVLPTGSVGLDHALGVGGLPYGRIVEIYGPEASGKTTLTLHLIANAQAMGEAVAFIDAEHALDFRYAAALGVKTTKLLLSQPECGEEALEICSMLVDSGKIGLIVIDSVSALTPKAEIAGDMGDTHVGLQARMMGQACRKLRASVSRNGCIVVFINQIRYKIGVMFGSPETTSGGNALKFFASVRLDMRSIGKVKDGEKVVANKTRVRVVKNKVADPFTEAEFQIKFGMGIDHATEIIELGVATQVLDKSGAWISYGGDRLGQGRAKTADMLRANPKRLQAMAGEVAAALEHVGALALTTARNEESDKPEKSKAKKTQTTSTAAAVAALSKKKPKK